MVQDFITDIHNYFQAELLTISMDRPVIPQERSHMSSSAKAEVAKASCTLPSGASKARKKYLNWSANCIQLLATFMN
eukprot:1302866-Lingulodinium_polyedra.AAC.1